jgi:hypothetical protein
MFVTCIQEICGSNPGRDIDYPDRIFMIFSVPPGIFHGSSLKLGHYRFLPHPFQFTVIESFDAVGLKSELQATTLSQVLYIQVVDKMMGTLRNWRIEFVCVGYIERTSVINTECSTFVCLHYVVLM